MNHLTRVAVVTGGHPFDVPNFHRLFRELEGVDACIQHMEDFSASRQRVIEWYDVVVFYHMLRAGPDEKPGLPRRPDQTLGHWLGAGKGVVMLHHAILAYPGWDLWVRMVGLDAGSFAGYSHGETMRIVVKDQAHPITRGLSNWEMIDETYNMGEPAADSHVLLTTDHPECMKTIGWTRQVNASRIFNLQSGHDNDTWANPDFREILVRGIQWAKGER